MNFIEVSSRKKVEALDFTHKIIEAVEKEKAEEGILLLFVPHCTCCLVTNEFEPNIVQDYEKLFFKLQEEKWEHNKIDDNAAAHLASAVAGESKFFFIEKGELLLGAWQRIILMELDGPRKRRVYWKILKT